jgi:hypothetical protein
MTPRLARILEPVVDLFRVKPEQGPLSPIMTISKDNKVVARFPYTAPDQPDRFMWCNRYMDYCEMNNIVPTPDGCREYVEWYTRRHPEGNDEGPGAA